MSHPPEYPGRDRLKRTAAQAGSGAYQGAFEAVGAVLISCGFGFWVDGRYETAPWGVLIGAVVGFAAMVLRLVRLGQELHPEGAQSKEESNEQETSGDARLDPHEEGSGVGVTLGMSDALRQDEDEADVKNTEEERRE